MRKDEQVMAIVAIVALGTGIYFWEKAKAKDPTVEEWKRRLDEAYFLDDLGALRMGANGFETLYSENKLTQPQYQAIYDYYLKRYNELAEQGRFRPLFP